MKWLHLFVYLQCTVIIKFINSKNTNVVILNNKVGIPNNNVAFLNNNVAFLNNKVGIPNNNVAFLNNKVAFLNNKVVIPNNKVAIGNNNLVILNNKVLIRLQILSFQALNRLLVLPSKHGYEGEIVKRLFQQIAIGKFGNPKHPLLVAFINR